MNRTRIDLFSLESNESKVLKIAEIVKAHPDHGYIRLIYGYDPAPDDYVLQVDLSSERLANSNVSETHLNTMFLDVAIDSIGEIPAFKGLSSGK
jgi:hypothetical protein